MEMTTDNALGSGEMIAEASRWQRELVVFPEFASSNIDHLLPSARIMVVDDEPINIKLARKVLQEVGYRNFSDVTDSRQTIVAMLERSPDLVLLDLMMPHLSGLDVLRAVRAHATLKHTPVVVLTASDDRETRLEALELGANDFLAKPVDRSELLPRVRNALTVKFYQDQLRHYANALEEAVRVRTAELAASRLEALQCLARAAEFRDDVTGRHVLRVGRYAGLIGVALGMSSQEAHMLELAAQLHDVGKIGIPDSILHKPDALTPDEFALMQRHCGMGKRVFESLDGESLQTFQSHAALGSELLKTARSPLIQLAARIALTHHERWDGSGYPIGLAGEDIPLEGRITAVADVFDALSSRRPYKPAYPLSKCFDMLEEGRGTHFDPTVLDAFFRQRNAIVAIQIELADGDG